MLPLGMQVMKDKKNRTRYKTSRGIREQDALRKAVVSSATRLAAVAIPGILRIIQDGDIAPPEGGMNGDGGSLRILYTMDISADLQMPLILM